jgi:hypothetical protein
MTKKRNYKKFADTLAREYELETKEDYFNIIIESLINGQRQQVRDQFNAMKGSDQQDFLIDYLKDDGSYHTSVKNICIGELTK